jgi:hypothetical protein
LNLDIAELRSCWTFSPCMDTTTVVVVGGGMAPSWW